MRVLLVGSPWTHPYHPGLATPSLTAFLRARGVEVAQRDASIEAFRHLISPEYLRRCLARVEAALRRAPRIDTGLAAAALKGEVAIERVPEALGTLRDPQHYYDVPRLQAAQAVLRCAFELVSAAHPPLRWTEISWELPGAYQSTRLALAAAADPRCNPFADWCAEALLPSLAAAPPDLLGISVSLDQMSQLVPALALARAVHERFPQTHICAGGIILSKHEERLPALASLLGTFDSIVLREGETPLLRIAEALAAGRPEAFADIPGVVALRGGSWSAAPSGPPEDLASLPAPDFSDLPLAEYLAPEPILPFAMGRGGCWYGRCSFCDSAAGHAAPYRRRPVASVVEDLAGLAQATGARRFVCADEAVEVPRLEALARALLDAGLDVRWSCWARAEAKLDRRRLDLLRRAGCTFVTYGVESASDRVLADMRKGNTRATVTRVVRDTAQAEIGASVNVILGYPTESPAERRESIDWLFQVRDKVVKANLLPFTFKAGTEAHRDRARFGATLIEHPWEDLAVFWSHAYPGGETQDDVNRLCEEVESALAAKSPVQRLAGELGQYPAVFLYLARLGPARLRELASAPAPSPAGALTASSRPRLDGCVLLCEPSPDLLAALGERGGAFAACVDARRGVVGWVPSFAARVLRRCDGETPLAEIARDLERELLVGRLGAEIVMSTIAGLPREWFHA